MRTDPDPESRASTSRLGDLYAHSCIIHRQHVVLAVSERTLLPVVLPATPSSSIVPRLLDATCAMLRAIHVAESAVALERTEMAEVSVARTQNRSVLGSVNDLVRFLDAYLDGRSHHDAAMHLAEVPFRSLGWSTPRRLTAELFSAPKLP